MLRELDRYDALYRSMLADYMNVLEEQKKTLEKQMIGTSLSSGIPIHSTKLCSLVDHKNGVYDQKQIQLSAFNRGDPFLAKLEGTNSKLGEAKRWLKSSFDQDMLDANDSVMRSTTRAKTTISYRETSLQDNP